LNFIDFTGEISYLLSENKPIYTKMKKLILSLAVISSLSLVSCGGAEKTEEVKTDSTAVCCPDTCASMNECAVPSVDTTSVVPTPTVH